MPLLENDVIFAYLNQHDKNHKAAEQVFEALRLGELQPEVSSVALLEMELIYRSRGIEELLLSHLAAVSALPNIKYAPLTPDLVLASVYLRQTLGLTFFDSHYAATALNYDRRIISADRAYDKVPGITRIDPTTYL
ncbi:PIN domain-containing protein [Candidatus Bathyarchaeota archaeon]|nr:PIN domain-containing protein [Candidatus Bathyarchaeota archaeon]